VACTVCSATGVKEKDKLVYFSAEGDPYVG
jgi:hypothetical protein